LIGKEHLSTGTLLWDESGAVQPSIKPNLIGGENAFIPKTLVDSFRSLRTVNTPTTESILTSRALIMRDCLYKVLERKGGL
jgi:hypothetical protein